MEKLSTMNPAIKIRTIALNDNEAVAKIIRGALEEFGANKPGTVYFDPTTDHLFELFQTPGSIYFVATLDDKIIGSGGIYPTENLPKGTCELVKLYLLKEARGTGLGRTLLSHSLQWAKENGYTQVYLETLPELSNAVSLYEKSGFTKIDHALGNSGHFICDIRMIKQL